MISRVAIYGILMLLLMLPCSVGAASLSATVQPGLNVVAVTEALASGVKSSYPLLTRWKSFSVTAVEAYDPANGTMLRAELDGAGNPVGVDFHLTGQTALYVYSTGPALLDLGNNTSCSPVTLLSGLNFFSYSCFPDSYHASELAHSMGLASLISLSRLDAATGTWQTMAVDGDMVAGDDFILTAGEGYLVQLAAVTVWNQPVTGTALALTPATLALQQGQPGAVLTVSLPGLAPVGGRVVNLVSSDPSLVSVVPSITITEGLSSVSVPLLLPDTGSAGVQIVTVTASSGGMADAGSVLSVYPKPTINLSPPTTLTGLTFTYLLTVSLSDTAPPGGFPVALGVSPGGVVSAPATVTIPAGLRSAQVTVTATAVGTATITATSPGRGDGGTANAVTVTPIQTMNYGPLVTTQVGVQVGPAANGPTGIQAGYGAASVPVGVTVGSAITGVVPRTGPVGAIDLKVTVVGTGFGGATDISFKPATGITVLPGSFAINSDGNPEVRISIDPTAAVTPRTVMVTLPAGSPLPAVPAANQFLVTLPEPQILSIQPTRAQTGQLFSLNLFGKNFSSATSIDISPATGISINNPPIVSADGTQASAMVNVSATAPTGTRVVTITTPGWTSSSIPSVANSFAVTADAGSTYSPLISPMVGVQVASVPPSTGNSVAYGPAMSLPVGVTVGSTITGISPGTGAIGTSGVKVTVYGIGLASAKSLSFIPADGITVRANSFAVNPMGNPEVIIDIDSTALTTMRTVVVSLPAGSALPSSSGANQFLVTLPEPRILSMQPIRAMVGQTVTLNVFGKNLSSASSIDFFPASGISVNNPPSVSSDGTLATVTFTISTGADIGDRMVTITTPGWTTSKVAAPQNTFHVSSDAGTTYSPLISQPVGVVVAAPSIPTQSSNYGPVTSLPLGIMVTTPDVQNRQSVTYSPAMSGAVGVVVGGAITGIAPAILEPGSSTTLTLSGSGLGVVTGVSVIPAEGISIGSWTAAASGKSGTVMLTATSAVAIGQKSIVAKTATGAVMPAVPAAEKLLVGYKPVINSISQILPTVGTTFTLTINGRYLQGATNVAILPGNNVAIDNSPVWSSDGTGEHLTVTVVIDATAAPGDRVVVVTTPYGVTTTISTPADTITFFKPGIVGSVGGAAQVTGDLRDTGIYRRSPRDYVDWIVWNRLSGWNA